MKRSKLASFNFRGKNFVIAAKFREHFHEAPPTTCTRQPIIFVANLSVLFVEKKFVKEGLITKILCHENLELYGIYKITIIIGLR